MLWVWQPLQNRDGIRLPHCSRRHPSDVTLLIASSSKFTVAGDAKSHLTISGPWQADQ